MRAEEVFPSRWITAKDADLDTPLRLTIASVRTVALPDRWQRAIGFENYPRELRLNRVNWETCARITGCDDDRHWIGTEIELYRAHVSYNGQIVPAVRVREPGRGS